MDLGDKKHTVGVLDAQGEVERRLAARGGNLWMMG